MSVLLEVLQNYMDAVNGATRMTQRKATAMARQILIQAGMEPAADMVHELSEQLIAAQEAQYAMVRQMIQSEVNMTLERMGVASHALGLTGGAASAAKETPEEPAKVTKPTVKTEAEEPARKAKPVEPTVDEPALATLVAVPDPEPEAEAEPAPAPAKKAPAKRAPAKRTTATKAAPAAKAAPATKKAPAKRAPVKRATKTTSAAKTTTAKTTPATAPKPDATDGGAASS